VLSWPLAYISPNMTWWYFAYSSIVSVIDVTFGFVPLIMWCLSVGIDYNPLVGSFLWMFIVEWSVIILQIVWDSLWMEGLGDWYYFERAGYFEHGWCNAFY